MGHVELDLKSPFVRLINQSHRMSNNPCKLSIRRLWCYRRVHSRAVDKLIPSHGPSSEAIAAIPKDQVTMTRDPQSANKQPFYCPRGSHRSNSVRFLTWLNLNRRSSHLPVTDCGDDDRSSSSSFYCAGQRLTPHYRTLEVRPGRITKKLELKYDYDCESDTHMLGGISKTVMVRAS